MPFEVPKGWMWAMGLDIFKPMKTAFPTGETFNYIDIDAIDNKRNIITAVKVINTNQAPSRASRYTEKGCVLFSMVRPYLRNIAIVLENNCIASTGFFVCHTKNCLLPKFCYYQMLSNYVVDGLNNFIKGDNSPSITKGQIETFLFPIPPREEQKRIVSVIEQWFTLINILEDAKGDLQNLISQAKSKILDLAIHGKLVPQDPTDEPAIELLKRINPKFTPCDNEHYPQLPAGWCIAPMKLLCSLEDGRKEENIERFNIDVKFLRGEREAKTINNGRYIVANSLLILVDGENSGEVFRTPIDGYQGSTFKRLVINENMCEEYLLYVISSHRKALRENKVGSAIPHLNKKLFKGIEVTIPPVNEQRRIVKSIKTLFNYIDNIAENL